MRFGSAGKKEVKAMASYSGIMLGNLTVKDMEKRCGITLSDSERETLEGLREPTCDKVDEREKIHIYDIPFMIVCGNPAARKTVFDILMPYAGEISKNAVLSIGGGVD